MPKRGLLKVRAHIHKGTLHFEIDDNGTPCSISTDALSQGERNYYFPVTTDHA